MHESAWSSRDVIFQVEHLSLAYPGRRGQAAATILSDVTVDIERGGALHARRTIRLRQVFAPALPQPARGAHRRHRALRWPRDHRLGSPRALDKIIASAQKFNTDRISQQDVAKAGGGGPPDED